MRIIIGLGNPGEKYKFTRHNAGFLAIDFLTKEAKADDWKLNKKWDCVVLHDQTSKTLYVKPNTFMNNSGKTVSAILNFYKLTTKDLLIIYDDIDLPFGETRFRTSGSSGGHKGMQSIIDLCGTNEIPRLRIGINQPERTIPTDAFVLQEFTATELKELLKMFEEKLKKLP